MAGIASPIPLQPPPTLSLLYACEIRVNRATTTPRARRALPPRHSSSMYRSSLPSIPPCLAPSSYLPSFGARRVNCRVYATNIFFPSATRATPGANSIRRRCTIAVARFLTRHHHHHHSVRKRSNPYQKPCRGCRGFDRFAGRGGGGGAGGEGTI